jgi:hypothetical protein
VRHSLFAQAIDDELAEISASRGLLKALTAAVELLRSAREDAENGHPTLTTAQARRLIKIKKAANKFGRECGRDWPDVERTQRLIGGWAEGLLNGRDLRDVIESVQVLVMEINGRLSDRSKIRHRKPDAAFRRFCLDVAVALAEAGEPVKNHHQSSYARILRILIQDAGEGVPKDLKRHMARAVRKLPDARSLSRSRSLEFEGFQKRRSTNSPSPASSST